MSDYLYLDKLIKLDHFQSKRFKRFKIYCAIIHSAIEPLLIRKLLGAGKVERLNANVSI